MKYVIVAPHADDEIIGCYELLSSGLVARVLFPNGQALGESALSGEHFLFGRKLIEDEDFYHSLEITYVFPDPYFEVHPKHRELGSLGESLLRQHRHVIFYNTTMSAPYVHEASQPAFKRECLNKLYPSKKDLWRYQHKYFLFEGYNKWIMKWDDLY